jgi:hypothetical protein
MIDNNLIWLLQWYYSQCDGDWEHSHGIQIATIDNPGWYLRLSLEETELQGKPFQKIKIDRSEQDWIRCFLEDNIFEGVGGPFNLPEILTILRKWVESCQKENQKS